MIRTRDPLLRRSVAATHYSFSFQTAPLGTNLHVVCVTPFFWPKQAHIENAVAVAILKGADRLTAGGHVIYRAPFLARTPVVRKPANWAAVAQNQRAPLSRSCVPWLPRPAELKNQSGLGTLNAQTELPLPSSSAPARESCLPILLDTFQGNDILSHRIEVCWGDWLSSSAGARRWS